MKIFTHFLSADKTIKNKSVEYDYLPKIGETISFSANGAVYEVVQVLHNMFACEYQVEVYLKDSTRQLF